MNSDPNASDARRISELDGWRGVSIICVIAGHSLNNIGAFPGARLAGVLAGWGVDIFFVISGFIIAKLALQERQRHGRFSVSRFYCRRIFRILPAFYVYLLAVTLLSSINFIKQNYLGVGLASIFTCNVENVLCGWFVGHSWSLAFEEQFYLAFPLLFYLSERFTREILIAVLAGLLIVPFLGYVVGDGRVQWVAGSFVPHLSFICIGVVAAAYETTVQRLAASDRSALLSLAGAAVLLTLLVLGVNADTPADARLDLLSGLNIVLLPPCLAWIVLTLIYQRCCANRLLRSRALQFIGLISYSLYLWQELFTATAENYATNSWWRLPPLLIVAATLSYYCIERPFIQIGRRLSRQQPDATVLAPAAAYSSTGPHQPGR